MQFSSRTDIAASAEFVFANLTDFDGWEALARAKGAQIMRQDPAGRMQAGEGSRWEGSFIFKGKTRNGVLVLREACASERLAMQADGRGIGGDLLVEITPIGAGRSRLSVQGELRPKSLAARLFVQSLRLAKGRVQAKLNKRVADYGRRLEGKYAARGES